MAIGTGILGGLAAGGGLGANVASQFSLTVNGVQIGNIVGAGGGIASIGLAGYSIYRDSRLTNLPQQKTPDEIVFPEKPIDSPSEPTYSFPIASNSSSNVNYSYQSSHAAYQLWSAFIALHTEPSEWNFAYELFNRYWWGVGGEMHLSKEKFQQIMKDAWTQSVSFPPPKEESDGRYSSNITFSPAHPKYGFTIGTFTGYYDRNFQPVGFYDSFDFPVRPGRSRFGEAATTIVRWSSPPWAKEVKILYP